MTNQVIEYGSVDVGDGLSAADQWAEDQWAEERQASDRWTYVCRYADLIAGRGVAALVDGAQVAVFRLADGSLHAVGNYDPGSHAYVISRGLTGTHEGVRTVASPIYKDLFDLRTGRCLTKDGLALPVHPVFRHRGLVFCQATATGGGSGGAGGAAAGAVATATTAVAVATIPAQTTESHPRTGVRP